MLGYVWVSSIVALSTVFLYKLLRKGRKRVFAVRSEEAHAVNILINTDLGMKHGKAISQACHAISGIFSQGRSGDASFDIWRASGEAKIVLKASGHDISEAVKNARNGGVCIYKVYDAGKTQVSPGSNTAVAIGPAPRSVLALLTGHLKLY